MMREFGTVIDMFKRRLMDLKISNGVLPPVIVETVMKWLRKYSLENRPLEDDNCIHFVVACLIVANSEQELLASFDDFAQVTRSILLQTASSKDTWILGTTCLLLDIVCTTANNSQLFAEVFDGEDVCQAAVQLIISGEFQDESFKLTLCNMLSMLLSETIVISGEYKRMRFALIELLIDTLGNQTDRKLDDESQIHSDALEWCLDAASVIREEATTNSAQFSNTTFIAVVNGLCTATTTDECHLFATLIGEIGCTEQSLQRFCLVNDCFLKLFHLIDNSPRDEVEFVEHYLSSLCCILKSTTNAAQMSKPPKVLQKISRNIMKWERYPKVVHLFCQLLISINSSLLIDASPDAVETFTNRLKQAMVLYKNDKALINMLFSAALLVVKDNTRLTTTFEREIINFFRLFVCTWDGNSDKSDISGILNFMTMVLQANRQSTAEHNRFVGLCFSLIDSASLRSLCGLLHIHEIHGIVCLLLANAPVLMGNDSPSPEQETKIILSRAMMDFTVGQSPFTLISIQTICLMLETQVAMKHDYTSQLVPKIVELLSNGGTQLVVEAIRLVHILSESLVALREGQRVAMQLVVMIPEYDNDIQILTNIFGALNLLLVPSELPIEDNFSPSQLSLKVFHTMRLHPNSESSFLTSCCNLLFNTMVTLECIEDASPLFQSIEDHIHDAHLLLSGPLRVVSKLCRIKDCYNMRNYIEMLSKVINTHSQNTDIVSMVCNILETTVELNQLPETDTGGLNQLCGLLVEMMKASSVDVNQLYAIIVRCCLSNESAIEIFLSIPGFYEVLVTAVKTQQGAKLNFNLQQVYAIAVDALNKSNRVATLVDSPIGLIDMLQHHFQESKPDIQVLRSLFRIICQGDKLKSLLQSSECFSVVSKIAITFIQSGENIVEVLNLVGILQKYALDEKMQLEWVTCCINIALKYFSQHPTSI